MNECFFLKHTIQLDDEHITNVCVQTRTRTQHIALHNKPMQESALCNI